MLELSQISSKEILATLKRWLQQRKNNFLVSSSSSLRHSQKYCLSGFCKYNPVIAIAMTAALCKSLQKPQFKKHKNENYVKYCSYCVPYV